MDKALLGKPEEFIVKNGKPVGVILSMETYEEILERLEDVEDLKMLKAMRQNFPEFRKFEDFLQEFKGV
ncbi:MAG TPA: type II toxin-antitoxin system prevent-host-death family antitoxin [bacterium]|nr:type II toxin-antitoxin system prevent-host-death family antitoxin [bacterium]